MFGKKTQHFIVPLARFPYNNQNIYKQKNKTKEYIMVKSHKNIFFKYLLTVL